MEFRRNIIFSVIAHASIAVMTLIFAGRNAGLSRLPQNYIAVSLLEYTNEKKSAPGDNLTRNDHADSKKPEIRSQGVSSSDSDERTVPRKGEKAVLSQYPKNGPSSEEKALNEGRYPDKDTGQTLDKVLEQPVSLQYKPAGPGKGPADNHPVAFSSGVQAITPGNSMEVRMTESHPADVGSDTRSLINRIRASIEKAKVYPILAKKRGQEGTVVTGFSISGKGQPENVRVVRSSGYNLLDAAARDTIIRAAPFPVVKGNMEVPIRFSLE